MQHLAPIGLIKCLTGCPKLFPTVPCLRQRALLSPVVCLKKDSFDVSLYTLNGSLSCDLAYEFHNYEILTTGWWWIYYIRYNQPGMGQIMQQNTFQALNSCLEINMVPGNADIGYPYCTFRLSLIKNVNALKPNGFFSLLMCGLW